MLKIEEDRQNREFQIHTLQFEDLLVKSQAKKLKKTLQQFNLNAHISKIMIKVYQKLLDTTAGKGILAF